MQQAKQFLANKDFAKAYTAFLKLAKNDPENEELRLYLAQSCLGLGRQSDALRLYKHLAVTLISKGKIAQAIAIQKKVQAMDPTDREIQQLLEKTYAKAEKPQDSEWTQVQQKARQQVTDRVYSPLEMENDTLELAGPNDRVTSSSQDMFYGKAQDELQMNVGGSSGLELAGEAPKSFPQTVLFSDFPRGAFSKLIGSFVCHTYGERHVVLREGEPGDSLFVVAQGNLEVFRGEGRDQKKVGNLQPGDFFGEFGYFSRKGRAATVVSCTPSEILELRRDKVEEITQTYPKVAEVMQKFYRQRVLINLLKESPLFSSLTDQERNVLAHQFGFRSLKAGEIVCREGEVSDSFYVIQSGCLEVLKANREDPVAELSAGEFFGEYALITGAPRNATIRAQNPCELLVMSGNNFREFLKSHPKSVEVLRQVAKSRLAQTG